MRLVGLLLLALGAAAPQASAATLSGRVVVLDPGHNGGNARAPQAINRLVSVGQGMRKACNTTGTATRGGYSEAAFTWDVAKRARALLQARGAAVTLTRTSNTSVGPCIDRRAAIANRARADATVSIHADGAAAGARGFHVIEPARIVGLTDDIFAPSHRLALALRDRFGAVSGMPVADYAGSRGIDRRGDLGGLRLADVPAVFVEAGNMRNPADAARLRSPAGRQRIARGIAAGIERFLMR